MTDTPLDQLGPVDYVVVEFPAGQSSFTGEMIDELISLVDAGTIRVIDVLILTKNEDGSVDAIELSDIPQLGELQKLEAELAELLASRRRRAPRRGDGPRQHRRRPHLGEPVGRARSRPRHAAPAGSSSPTAASRSRRSSPRSRPTSPSTHRRSDMPLRPARIGRVGVIGHPVAKTAVVAKAVTPGPAPVAKTAVVAAAVTPGRRRRI